MRLYYKEDLETPVSTVVQVQDWSPADLDSATCRLRGPRKLTSELWLPHPGKKDNGTPA